MVRIFFIFIVVLLLLGAWFWFGTESKAPTLEMTQNTAEIPSVETPPLAAEPVPTALPQPAKPMVRDIQHAVPFTSQAPTGEWGKSAFQDGCEEASTLMVWMARNDKKLTPQAVKEKLLEMATFQEKRIGHGVDTNVHDTHEYLLKQYFEITDAREAYDISLDELREAVMEGLVIVPTNGRLLGNPNFTAPGPLQHMLVIVGYDTEKKEFITNDPGTRKGADYRYPEQVLYDAIREYPTGKHLPIATSRKAMLVIPLKVGEQVSTNLLWR